MTVAADAAGTDVDAARNGWLRRLVPYIERHRRDAAVVFVAALGGMAVTAVLPLFVRAVVDDSIVPSVQGGVVRPIGPLLVAMALLGLVRFGLSFVRRFGAGRLGIDIEYDLRNDIYDHLHRLDFARHDEFQSGQLVSRANSDVRVLQQLLGYLPFMSGNIFLFGLSVIIMFGLSVPLTLVALIAVPTLFVMALHLRKVVYPSSWDAQQRAAEVATVVDEATNGVRVVKAFGQEQRELDKLTDSARDLFGARMRNSRISARRQATMQTVPSLAQVAILVFGGWLTIQGEISLGTLLAFQTSLVQLVAPVRQMAGMLVTAQTARAAAERIFELLDCTSDVEERPHASDLDVAEGRIELRGVRFGYLRSEPVLDGFDLTVEPGEVVALVGASGSGKSTVSLLVPRFYDVQEGQITIDGTDVRAVSLDSLRASIGVVFEESFLFSATIRENIAYGVPDATDDQVEQAARWAQAEEFVRALPDGYDTVVGERGLTLSGGQRQRIALARALITDPRILLLDDATSSVDVRMEEEIHSALRSVMRGRTTILVAHRRSTLHLADRVVVVDAGRVVDQGTHDELWSRSSTYRELLGGPDAAPDLTPEGTVPGAEPDGAADADAEELAGSAWPHDVDLDKTLAEARRAGYAATRQALGMRAGPARLNAPPTPELLAAIEALPPVVDEPEVDTAAAAKEDPEFSFRQLMSGWRRPIVVASVLLGLNALAALAGPRLVGMGVDRGIVDEDMGWLLIAAGLFLATVVLIRVLSYASTMVTARLGQNLLFALRIRVFAHLQRLGLDYYDREMAGRIMTRMTSDITALQSLLQSGFIDALVQGVTFVGALLVLVSMSPPLALVVLTIVPPLAGATLMFRTRSEEAYGRVRDRIAAVNANFQESISGVRVAQAFGRESRNIEGFREVAGSHRTARIDSTKISSAYFPFVELLSGIATILVLWVGGALAEQGRVSAGDLFAFVLYLTAVFAPVQQLSQVFDTYQQGKVALDRLGGLLATPTSTPEVPDATDPGRVSGDIRYVGVDFTYAGSTLPALSDIDLHIVAGETVAFVGETGAGKSTIVKLAARLYDPTSGTVAIDGRPLTELNLAAVRHQIGVVPQEAFLFTGTIRDNIAYARPDATDDEVEAAARATGAHEFVARLPLGYLQPVIERGRSLSSGQRQLIALARAQLVDPAILILDEATANLDLGTEARVVRAMGVVAEGRTTLLIAHRLQTAVRADRIVVMDGGRIAEVGSHDALIAAKGAYAEMWAAYMGEGPQPSDRSITERLLPR